MGMENQTDGAKLQLLNQQMGYLPSIGVSYQNNIQYMSPEANIFDDAAEHTKQPGGGKYQHHLHIRKGHAQVQEARIQRDQALIGLQQMEEGLIMQHAALVNDFHQGIADFLAQKESVELAKRIRNQRRLEYKEGLLLLWN